MLESTETRIFFWGGLLTVFTGAAFDSSIITAFGAFLATYALLRKPR